MKRAQLLGIRRGAAVLRHRQSLRLRTYTSLLDYITGNPVRYTFDGELGMSKKIKLVKVNGNYYYIDQYLEADNAVQFGGRSIEYTLYTKNEETAVFCSGIKKLAPGSYYYWWYPLYYAILIAEGSYKTTSCNNPNVNGAIVLSPIELAYKDLLSTGSDEPQYISASVTITPV